MGRTGNSAGRRDAVANRDALLDAAERVLQRTGARAPLDAIAREAEVGIATLYRNFANRDALYEAVVHRAYLLVAELASEAEHHSGGPLDAVTLFLNRVIEHRDRLILPLLGGPRPRPGKADQLGARVTASLTAVLQRGIRDGSIRADADATDVIVAGAMLAKPELSGQEWHRTVTRQAKIFIDGLRCHHDNTTLPPPMTRQELDAAVTSRD